MTVIYVISKIITFPGAYLRCFWEQLMCGLFSLPVERGGYMHLDEGCGHVEHPLLKSVKKAFFLAAVPGFMNLIVGLFIALPAFVNIFVLELAPGSLSGETLAMKVLPCVMFAVSVLFLYVGISILCNVFPLVEDAMNIYELIYKGESNIFVKIIAFVPTVIMYAGAYLEKYAVTAVLWIAAVVCMIFI